MVAAGLVDASAGVASIPAAMASASGLCSAGLEDGFQVGLWIPLEGDLEGEPAVSRVVSGANKSLTVAVVVEGP